MGAVETSDQTPTAPARVAVVDDEPAIVEIASHVLAEAGFEIERAYDAEGCLALLGTVELDAVLTDICMDSMDGFELIGAIGDRAPGLRTVVMTGHDTYEMVRRALAAGAYDYLDKPLDRHDAIVATVGRAVEATRLARHNDQLLGRLAASNAELAAANERLVELNGRLRLLAHTDALTGLHNRRHADAALARALERHARGRGTLAVALFDVDAFKAYNDRFGHDGGDRALREVARHLRHAASRGHTVARYGGEEFIAILPGSDLDDAVRWANEVRVEVERATAGASGEAGPLTLSAGVAALGASDRPGEPDAVLRAADAALYAAKAAGRNRVVGAGPDAVDGPVAKAA